MVLVRLDVSQHPSQRKATSPCGSDPPRSTAKSRQIRTLRAGPSDSRKHAANEAGCHQRSLGHKGLSVRQPWKAAMAHDGARVGSGSVAHRHGPSASHLRPHSTRCPRRSVGAAILGRPQVTRVAASTVVDDRAMSGRVR